MIIVSVILVSANNGQSQELARMEICNMGTGTAHKGNYSAETLRGRSSEDFAKRTRQRIAYVNGHPRLREHVWNLVAKCLAALRYGDRHDQPSAEIRPPDSWIVSNGAGDRWRTWRNGWPEWTANRDEATRYARRMDAEAAHAEDDLAWRVEPYGQCADSWGAYSNWATQPRHTIEALADKLVNQNDEPFPGPDSGRLHYWRDKAIAIASQLRALATRTTEEGAEAARDLFDAGFAACWAEAFTTNGEVEPFPLNDAAFDRAWEIYVATRENPPLSIPQKDASSFTEAL